ncbi:hypothetical protein I6N95_06905 [Vagococcus sp. BWB3-3]|uniref:Serpin domain-containing protein n=1 Tax=Vagococcus allomyrinae TaxID=2794353 RepID=A0A940PB13_9ENTE|nr:serpin family protein [Vagococcus allomyrinae]MBP1040728.1 hypothetical protein [Vagococcus allomyrinae]
MKKIGIVLGLSVSLLLLLSCGEPDVDEPVVEPLQSSTEVALSSIAGAESFNQFAAASGSLILQEEGNQLYGPVGPYQLLSLLSEGTVGQSRQAIYNVLQTDAERYPSSRTFNQALLTAYQDKAVASVANSLWLDQQQQLTSSFEQVVKGPYSASVEAVPFAKNPKKAAEKIASWVKQQLGADLFDKSMVNQETRLMLVNTVRLNLAWLETFETSQTVEQFFYADDQKVATDFMQQEQKNHQYFQGNCYTASSLTLEKNHRLLFILPDAGISVNQLIATPESLHELIEIDEQERADVNFAIPKFKLTNDLDLVTVMQRLGLTSIFDPEQADLNQLIKSDLPLFIASFKQTNQLELNENNVKVESVTSLGGDASAAMPQEAERLDFTLDRPFIFIIQGEDGLPLFMGVIRNPTIEE